MYVSKFVYTVWFLEAGLGFLDRRSSGFLDRRFLDFCPRNAAINRYNQEIWFLLFLGKMNNTFGKIPGDFGYPFIENPTQGCIESFGVFFFRFGG